MREKLRTFALFKEDKPEAFISFGIFLLSKYYFASIKYNHEYHSVKIFYVYFCKYC